MEPNKRYYTMGQFVHDHKPMMIDMDIDYSIIVRSTALQIAADKDVDVRFHREENGPRRGEAVLKLPKWVWEEAFEKEAQS